VPPAGAVAGDCGCVVVVVSVVVVLGAAALGFVVLSVPLLHAATENKTTMPKAAAATFFNIVISLSLLILKIITVTFVLTDCNIFLN
jgi:uncharacterized membrane protein YdbT with pleckstrin-like domain